MERLKKPRLRVLGLDITGECDCNCVHCGRSARKGHLSLDAIREILDSGQRVGLTDVVIAGGEPFVHPEIDDILEETYRRRLYVSILSNGTAITRAHAEHLSNLPNLSYVRLSVESHDPDRLDSIRRSPGSSDRFSQSIRALRKAEVPIGISMTVGPHNVSDIPGVIDFAIMHFARFIRVSPQLELDTEQSSFHPAIDPAEVAHAFVTALADRDRYLNTSFMVLPSTAAAFARRFAHPCPAGQFMMSVQSDMQASFCPFTIPEFSIDLRETSLEKAWRTLVEYRAKETRDLSASGSDASSEQSSHETDRRCTECLIGRLRNGNGQTWITEQERMGLSPIARALFERLADAPREARRVLSGFLSRQFELNELDINPCWRSSPLFIVPLRAVGP
jgi:MoaA/NifB/PqqE/SkfB family radical SAM enzyme